MLVPPECRPPMEPTLPSSHNIITTAPVSAGERAMKKPMSHVREIAFIDPAVVDVPSLVAGLRPEVVPVLLGGELPAAQVIARTLRDYEDLDAIHIVAHGRPGDLSFSNGALTLSNIKQYATDLAAIGDALGPYGEVLLWSCHTGEGAGGRAFVRELSQIVGAPVAAATGLVGSALLGGNWELDTRSHEFVARPPLTNTGAAEYNHVLILNLATVTIVAGNGNTIGVYYLVQDGIIIGIISLPNLAAGADATFRLPVDVNPLGGACCS